MTDYKLAHELFTYDAELCGLRWKVGRGSVKAGEPAGGDNKLGYFRVNFGGKFRLCSHIVWLMHKGAWPTKQLDHINRDSKDDRIENLREVSHQVNQQNKTGANRSNKAGLRGVSLDNGKYRATIVVNRKQIWLGEFDTAEKAHEAYLKAKSVYHKGAVL